MFVPVPGVIALISCDPADYNGNIPVANLLQAAQLANITAVFYSQQADYCEWQGTGTSSDAELYTMKVLNNTLAVLHQVRLLQGTAGGNTTHIVLAPYGSRTSDGGPSSTTGNTTTSPTALKDPGGPPPSTQVAMVVLYSELDSHVRCSSSTCNDMSNRYHGHNHHAVPGNHHHWSRQSPPPSGPLRTAKPHGRSSTEPCPRLSEGNARRSTNCKGRRARDKQTE